jgi:ubiquinol-cytochrome c reductase cytochrome c subunit
MLTTGRMPLANSEDRPVRKDPAYRPDQIRDLIAYVSTLGDGPPIPHVDIALGDLSGGGELYRANCATCHQAAGIGGALSYGNHAPALDDATPVQVVEAMRIGPGQMPVFDQSVINEPDARDIAAYVRYLRAPDDRGGLSLGRSGPFGEGFVALAGGLGGLTVLGAWVVGRRRHVG